MTSATIKTPDPNRMGIIHKLFVAGVICISVGFIAYSVNFLSHCRAERAQVKSKLIELKKAGLAGIDNSAELAATDTKFKDLCSRCGVDN